MKSTEMQILTGMHRNINSLDKKTANLASKFGLTFSQFMVLEALYSKGDMSIGEVMDSILSTVGTISLIVKNLEKLNYIERLKDEKDGRVCILHLTQDGYDVISKIAPKNKNMITDNMSILSEREKQDLLFLLKKLGGKLDEKRSKK